MAYEKIYQRWGDTDFYVADSDSDVSTIESEQPDAPIGSTIIVSNSGSLAVYMKFPTDGFTQISSHAAAAEEET